MIVPDEVHVDRPSPGTCDFLVYPAEMQGLLVSVWLDAVVVMATVNVIYDYRAGDSSKHTSEIGTLRTPWFMI